MFCHDGPRGPHLHPATQTTHHVRERHPLLPKECARRALNPRQAAFASLQSPLLSRGCPRRPYHRKQFIYDKLCSSFLSRECPHRHGGGLALGSTASKQRRYNCTELNLAAFLPGIKLPLWLRIAIVVALFLTLYLSRLCARIASNQSAPSSTRVTPPSPPRQSSLRKGSQSSNFLYF